MSKIKEMLSEHLPSKLIISIEITITDDGIVYCEDTMIDTKRFTKNGLGSNIGQVKINAYGGEGDLPHFHVISKDKKKTDRSGRPFHACVRLDTNRYFNHGFKNGEFNNDELKRLYEILSLPYKPISNNKKKKLKKRNVDPNDLIKDKFKSATNIFSALCIGWNADLQNTIKVKNIYDIPDYIHLREANNEYPEE